MVHRCHYGNAAMRAGIWKSEPKGVATQPVTVEHLNGTSFLFWGRQAQGCQSSSSLFFTPITQNQLVKNEARLDLSLADVMLNACLMTQTTFLDPVNNNTKILSLHRSVYSYFSVPNHSTNLGVRDSSLCPIGP